MSAAAALPSRVASKRSTAEGVPPLWTLAVFSAGVWLTRSAGCVINDYADRWLDPDDCCLSMGGLGLAWMPQAWCYEGPEGILLNLFAPGEVPTSWSGVPVRLTVATAYPVDGAVAGVWETKKRARKVELRLEPLVALSQRVRKAVAKEAERLGEFLGTPVELLL